MTLRDQAVEAGQAFYEYQYLTRAIAVSRENIDLAKDLLAVVEESYRAGSGSQANVVKLQTALARQENELRDMEAMRAGQAAKLNALLDRKANAPLGAPDDKEYPQLSIKLEPLVERALRQRQEIQMQQAKVERTKTAIRMSEIMNRPLASQGYSLLERGMMAEAAPEMGGMETQQQGGGLGGDAGEQRAGSGAKGGMGGGGSDRGAAEANGAPMGGAQGEGNPSFGLRAKTVPRPLYAQAESYLAEMRQRLGAEQSQLEQVIAQTRGQARMMLEELDVARREVELVRGEVLPKNEFTYNTARSAYTAGQTTFLDMLDAERMLLESRMELQKARRDQNKAALNLAMTAGEFLK
jgi:outer membrane protein TolC